MKTVLSPSRTKHSWKTYRMVTEVMENSRSRSTRVSKGRRDREPSRLPWRKILNLFNKSKAIKRYVRSHIVHSVPHSSAFKNNLSFDYRNYLSRICRCKPGWNHSCKSFTVVFCNWLCLSFQNKNCET